MTTPRHKKTVDRILMAIREEVRPGEPMTANELRRRIFDRVQVSTRRLSAIIRVYGTGLVQINHSQDEPHSMFDSYQGRDSNG